MKKQILQRIYDKPYKDYNLVNCCLIGIYMSGTSFISNINKMTKQELEQQKNMLVWQLNIVQKKIDDYWLLDVAYNSWPFKNLAMEKQRIEKKIKDIKKLLDNY